MYNIAHLQNETALENKDYDEKIHEEYVQLKFKYCQRRGK